MSGDRLWGILLKILRECENSAAERVKFKAKAEQQERPMVAMVVVVVEKEKGKERIFFEKLFESEELAELTGEFEAWNEQARTEAKVSENRLAMSRYG